MGCKPSTQRYHSNTYQYTPPKKGQCHPNKTPSDGTLGISQAEASAAKGRIFDEEYSLGKELGRGAFAVVYDGTKKQKRPDGSIVARPSSLSGSSRDKPQEHFAIKVVKRSKLSEDDENALQEEISILQTLEHPNIIQLVDVLHEPLRHYLVMEKVAGGELFHRIVQKSYYNEKEARDTCVILLHAIQYLHAKKVAHRDLKPENLLLLSDKNDTQIKLADFGFAKACPNDECLRTQCGTPCYVAPEILAGVPYGTKSDMWSLGVIMYILLGGYPPFMAKTNQELFRKIRRGQYKFHDEYWSSVSEQAKSLISSLLTIDPAKRLSANQALDEPFVERLSNDELLSHDLSVNLDQLKLNFDPRCKLKGSVHAVMLTHHLINKSSEEEEEDENEKPKSKRMQKLESLSADVQFCGDD